MRRSTASGSESGLRLKVNLPPKTVVPSADLQELLLGVLGHGKCPKWAKVQRKDPPHVCVVTYPGVLHGLYCQAMSRSCKWLFQALGPAVKTQLQGRYLRRDSALWDLWMLRRGGAPAPAAPAPAPSAPAPDPATAAAAAAPATVAPCPAKRAAVAQYLLTPEERSRIGFQSAGADGYVQLPPRAAGPEPDRLDLVAIDCEMCVTAQGPELTRATVISGSGGVLYDELVKPYNEITKYLTHVSGITEVPPCACCWTCKGNGPVVAPMTSCNTRLVS